jgi:hypothetical protein
MGRAPKPNFECCTPSSEPFRFYLPLPVSYISYSVLVHLYFTLFHLFCLLWEFRQSALIGHAAVRKAGMQAETRFLALLRRRIEARDSPAWVLWLSWRQSTSVRWRSTLVPSMFAFSNWYVSCQEEDWGNVSVNKSIALAELMAAQGNIPSRGNGRSCHKTRLQDVSYASCLHMPGITC